MTRVNYQDYIHSKQWRSLHTPFLKASGNRCAMFPWMRVGRVNGKYHPYNLHHMTYENLGRESYWWDVLPLSDFAHDHIIHGVLSGYKRPSQQKNYPNAGQRVFHCWCRVPAVGKVAIALYVGWLLMNGGAS